MLILCCLARCRNTSAKLFAVGVFTTIDSLHLTTSCCLVVTGVAAIAAATNGANVCDGLNTTGGATVTVEERISIGVMLVKFALEVADTSPKT